MLKTDLKMMLYNPKVRVIDRKKDFILYESLVLMKISRIQKCFIWPHGGGGVRTGCLIPQRSNFVTYTLCKHISMIYNDFQKEGDT